MFVYLSKKIAMPNNSKLLCVAWNKSEGYIACGGENGLLRIMQLESPLDVKGKSRQSSLSMNQGVAGHTGFVQMARWNDYYKKLTTSDINGLIIVWGLSKDKWIEEMVNNRHTVIQDMKWNADGKMICIVFEDGVVIVGTVDGERIWGRNLGGRNFSKVEWSPDSKMLLFGMINGEVHVYDNMGNYINRVVLHCLNDVPAPFKLVSIYWYNGSFGYIEANCPSLLICYTNGRVQIMRSEIDNAPVVFDTQMRIEDVAWNHLGSTIAIAGSVTIQGSDRETNFIHFYSPLGEHLRSLKIPGKELKSCAWEGFGLRLAVTVDHLVYFANIKPDYKWGYCSTSVVYSFTKPDRSETSVVFWETTKDEKFIKYMKSLTNLISHGEYCCLITKNEETAGQYILVLCNSIGTPLEQKDIDMEPMFLEMTKSYVIVASREVFYMWQFQNPKKITSVHLSSRRSRREKLFHIDKVPGPSTQNENIDFNLANVTTTNPICAICASDKIILIARENGVIHHYSLPHVMLEHKYNFNVLPSQMAINSNSTILAIVDNFGVLTFYQLEGQNSSGTTGKEFVGERLKFERKDVWNIKWASDNPDLFAMMEKDRMYVIRGLDPEEPVICKGYICQFSDLQIKTVLLDDIMLYPENPTKGLVVDIEIKALRDTRGLLEKVGIEEAQKFIEDNPHPRLWYLLAEAALDNMNLTVAEQAFVHCKDYHGIQFVKRLNNQTNESIRKAEILCYFKKFDEAEDLYVSMDRRDLAVSLRKMLGDWFRVAALLKSGGVGDDVQLEEAWNAIGDYYADRQKWQEAVSYYEQGRNQVRLADCYYILEDFAGLEKMINALPENHELLPKISAMFVTVGMCDQAVEAFIKCNRVRDAIDCCIHLNQWNMAIDLARQHAVKDIDSLLTKYAGHLLEKGRSMNAIELYRKAGHYLEAAKLLLKEANRIAKKAKPLLMKKMYVLTGLLMEKYHEQMKFNVKSQKGKKADVSSSLEGFLEEDTASMYDAQLVDSPWHHAEAYHFYLLTHTQLQAGYVDAAMKTALVLRDYEDVLDPVNIYSLLALAACANRAFGTCSKAFIKLESLESLEPAQKQQFEDLAFEIFTRHSPKDSKSNQVDCPSCASSMPDWASICASCDAKYPPCIVSGRTILDYHYWMCNHCKHRAYESEILQRQTCPLCHSPF
ncbi:WDR35 [Acanthosepion pharaonis]|uniref:WDR35 n=1 Tax=Acanthosepion pharaonis TaxID=158019 RepID=A0A812DVQ7_ACAPH|nr:WDR35 [Sepia pharaonis]